MQDRSKLDEQVSVAPYDPSWVVLFEQEAKQLSSLLGTRQIQHIGSTAVPGMAAKPIVDILIGLQKQELVDEMALAIITLGFEDMGEAGIVGRRHLRKRSPFAVNIHLVLMNSNLWRNNLILRDYLRTHPDEAQRYGEHKYKIISGGTNTLLAYSEQKTSFIQDLIQRAQIWERDQRMLS